MSDVQATRVHDFFAEGAEHLAGAFDITGLVGHEGLHSILFVCPCGCGEIGNLPLNIIVDPSRNASWDWDGDEVAPTLKPSVQRMGGCRWHGFLTKGVWKAC